MLKNILAKIYRLLERSHHQDLYRNYRKKYEIDQDFLFNGKNIEFYGDGRIKAGKNSYIGNNSAIQASKNTSVVIGDGVSISHNVRVYTSNRIAKSVCSKNRNEIIQYEIADVVIGDNVWIGANVLILQGSIIGSNVVIGANSVVKGIIKANTIVAVEKAKVVYDCE